MTIIGGGLRSGRGRVWVGVLCPSAHAPVQGLQGAPLLLTRKFVENTRLYRVAQTLAGHLSTQGHQHLVKN
eukprot:scaffold10883_cov74-Phaeocystis_antarctica.AAC.3